MTALPKEINYAALPSSLPAGTRTISVVSTPVNGSTFSGLISDQIIFDIGSSRGYLVPNSMYLRYKHNITKSTEAGTVNGTPSYSPFARSEIIVGGQTIESIQNYGQLCNMIINTKLNHAKKAGMAYALGLLDTTTTISYANLNAGSVPIGTNVLPRAMFLPNIISNCDNLVPLHMLNGVRIVLTTDSQSNYMTYTTAPSANTLSSVELCFDVVVFPDEVDSVVRTQMINSNGDLIIKTQSYNVTSQNLPSGSSGVLEYVFNQRSSSIKSLFAIFSPTSTGVKLYGGKDITKSLGSYQFFIAGEPYPQRPLDATNKAGMLMELTQAWNTCGSIETYDNAITPAEWSYNDGTADSALIPSKFYIGCNVERLSSSSPALLSGISSQNSSINLRVNIPSSTTDSHLVTLISLCDELLVINVPSKQLTVQS